MKFRRIYSTFLTSKIKVIDIISKRKKTLNRIHLNNNNNHNVNHEKYNSKFLTKIAKFLIISISEEIIW